MGVTRFPNGITLSAEGAGTVYYGVGASTDGFKTGSLAGTVLTGAGTVAASAFGLASVTAACVSLAGTATGIAGTAAGNPWVVRSRVSSGAVVVDIRDATGAVATNAGTVAIVAHGS